MTWLLTTPIWSHHTRCRLRLPGRAGGPTPGLLHRRLELDLDPAGPVLGEGLVGLEGRGDRLALGQDAQGVDRAIAGPVDELGQIATVVAVAGLDGQVPIHRHAHGE